jgi:hypothetical protein
VTSLRVGRPVNDEMFLFTIASRPALGPTQSPIQWIEGVLTPGIKRSKREVDHLPLSSAQGKYTCSYISTFHGVVLN